MKRTRISKKLNVVKKMPPLFHTLPGIDFDIKKSMVINWFIQKPDILNYLWDQIKNSGYVEYNSDTGEWKGIDYAGN